MLALTSATGKLGSAVITTILENELIDPQEVVICTSSDPSSLKLALLHTHTPSLTIRRADFNSPDSLRAAYTSCTALFLVSTPCIEMDYDNAPEGKGREAHHRAAIDAALSVGVTHIYYTSLAFANPSSAGVMRAHVRTEAYLKELEGRGKVDVTILREGLYNESWPLYFGYYFGLKKEDRKEVVVAGDGLVSWTAIADMAFATAKILVAPRGEWKGRTVYLSQKRTCTLRDVAKIVSRVRGEEVMLKIVGKKEYEEFYRQKGRERLSVEWWSSTYDALEAGECAIKDETLERMLEDAGRKPKALEDTIKEMLG